MVRSIRKPKRGRAISSKKSSRRAHRSHAVRFVQFAVVGGFATGIQYCVLFVLVHFAQLDPVIASAIGFVVSAFLNYVVNYRYTFASDERHVLAGSKFAALASIGLMLNSLILAQLIDLGLHYLVAQLIATVAVLVWNFVGNSVWTFRRRSVSATNQRVRSGIADRQREFRSKGGGDSRNRTKGRVRSRQPREIR